METSHSVVVVNFVKREAGQRDQATQKANNSAWWAGNNASSDYRLIEPLTDRELRFLDCLAHGVSNKEIARSLCVSENTVKFHLKNVYSKFAVRTRLQAIKAAYELGVLPTPETQGPEMTGVMA